MKRTRLYILLTIAALNLRANDSAEKPMLSSELSPEIKEMQKIEPGFWPKSEKAVELFMRQREAFEKEETLKKTLEEIKTTRELFLRKFREELALYINKKAGSLEALSESDIVEAIKYLEEALKYPEHSIYEANALYQLGYFYFERDEKDYFEKLARYSKAFEEGRDDVEYPEENFSPTIKTYRLLLKEYPDYPQRESVYYLLGLALWYEGDFYGAVDTFKTLIEKFPSSRYVEELWFRLGEYHYDMNDYDEAIKAYEKVAKNPSSPLYDKALYKIAWSHFQKDRYMLAIENFQKVLDLTYKEKGDKALSSMRAEVTRYIVKCFSDELFLEKGQGPINKNKKEAKDYAEQMGLKLANRIIAHFGQSNKPYIKDIYIETASQLLDESKVDGAIKIFNTIIDSNKNSQDNPLYQSQIVDILQEADRLSEAREQNVKLIETYGKKSHWYHVQEEAHNLLALRNAREAVRDAMLSLAVHYHKLGKELKLAKDEKGSDDNFSKAASLYLEYINEYPERDDTHKAIFYFAESEFEINNFRTALEAYELLKEYPLPMPNNYRRDATFNIVFTFRHVLESEAKEGRFKEINFDALTAKSRGLEKEEIPEIGLKYLAAIDDFLKIAPTDEQVPVLLFHRAAIYYVYGHYDEALSGFFYIIDHYPLTVAASASARLILDDAIAKEDWPKVIELSRLFKEKLPKEASDFAKFEGDARFKMARAVFESANELKKNNQLSAARDKYRESAKLFAEILAAYPKNPYADIMLFNQARAVTESGTMSEALPLYRKLYTEYPKSEYA